jgi:hypothetical protein
MLFCFGEGKWEQTGGGYQKKNCIFNIQVTEEEFDKALATLPDIKIELIRWVDAKDMTLEEKEIASNWKENGGYLKRFTYEEAWANWWASASKKDKQAILNLPHFNSDIFEGITGIKVVDCTNEDDVIEVNGKRYKPVEKNGTV